MHSICVAWNDSCSKGPKKLTMFLEIILGILTLFLCLYFYVTRKWNIWSKKGVPFVKPKFPLGSVPEFFNKKRALIDIVLEHAKRFKDVPFYGIFFLGSPALVVKDVDLVKQILVKDFDHFVDRRADFLKGVSHLGSKNDRIWLSQLTNATGDEWKNLRSTFTPIFTTGKMKAMLFLMKDTCSRLIKALDDFAERKQDFELKECLGKYSMDTIASCAFGVDAQSFTDPNSRFLEYAGSLFKSSAKDRIKLFAALLPLGYRIMSALGISITKVNETEFFYQAVIASLKHRRETKSKRNDLIDLMMDAMKQGEAIEVNSEEEEDQFEKDAKLNHTSKKTDFDELVIVATAMVFLVAGYDTTGTTLAFACYQLAKHQDVQEKLRSEVQEILGEKSLEDISYEDLNKMTYMDQVISETLRLFNPAPALTRTCVKDYKVPGHDLVIEKGIGVWISSSGIHHDPEHYANPEAFDPEHFSNEAKANRHPYAFLPFGQGPRNCIGMRFAQLEAKLGLANIVSRFTLQPSDKTQEPLVIDPIPAITYVKNGLHVRVDRI